MRTFLGLLMVLNVSGDNLTIKGVVGDSVLLPCTCKYDKDFKWQWADKFAVYSKELSNKSIKYTGRTRVFLSESRNNCSILLDNITAEDQGEYKCSFRTDGLYQRSSVYLNVSASYSVCQKRSDEVSGAVKVFQCEVAGIYSEALIQWTWGGQLLTNSATTNISIKHQSDAVTGFYHFNSQLRTNLNWTSEPTCDVKASNISTTLNNGCNGSAGTIHDIPERVRLTKVFPIMLAVGLFLCLFHRVRRRHT